VDELNAVLIERRDLTDAVAHFRIRPEGDAPAFEPGQYFALGLPVGERLIQRPYSAASAPARPGDLEFFIRRVEGGALTPRLWALRPGARVRLGRPKGLFRLLRGDRRAHLFLATGTGLAPVVAMVEALLAAGDPPPIVVLHGVAHAAELGYRERLEAWSRGANRFSYMPTISRPLDPRNRAWQGRIGHLDTILGSIWAELGLTAAGTVAYLCGNPAVVAAGERILGARGLPAEAVRSEHYWPLAA
jgi:ferredoxin/flavodoxin---NADP+ reductase